MAAISNGILFPCTSGGNLFTQFNLPAPEKLRPLGQLSDFIVEDLPKILAQVRLGKWSSKQIWKSDSDFWYPPPIQNVSEELRPLACLDFMLLQQACDHVGAPFPEKLRTPADEFCRSLGRINTLLYEDCVLSNSLTRDPRVFTQGDVGVAERDFLLVHTLIERCLDNINGRVRDILHRLEEEGSALMAQAVSEHSLPMFAELQRLRALFLSMRRMRREDFQAFREYYMPSPRTKHPGPSGRFSAKFFLLRILVEGSAIQTQIPTFYREVLDIFQYFPRRDREILLSYVLPEYLSGNQLSEASREILEAFGGQRVRFSCLRDAYLEPWSRSTGLPELVASVRQTLDACTSIHMGLVQKNIIKQNGESAAIPS